MKSSCLEPRALIFGIYHHIVDISILNINILVPKLVNQGVFYIDLYGKNKNSSCLKPLRMKPLHLVYSINWLISTKFVKIKHFGQKWPCPGDKKFT